MAPGRRGADLVVVGSGVAGLTAALDAAGAGLRVVVVTKDAADAGSTRWAQGGVAVVVGDVPGDSVDAHVADTLTAGAGLCDPAAVASILTDGPAAVARLRARGAVFDATPTGALERTREGGHSAFRVVRAGGDATGAEVERALVAAARGAGLPLLTGHVAVDALRAVDGTVAGVTVLDDAGRPGVLHAPAVLLATGGYGQLFASTTNPATLDRRRRRAGPARRRDRRGPRVRAVPPHRPARARSAWAPAAGHRGGPGRGRRAARPHRRPVHGRRAPAGRARPAGRRRRGDHPADGADRRGVRVARRHRGRGLRRPLPHGDRLLPGRGDRPHTRTDSGDARRPLRLRGCGHRRRRAHRGPRPLRRR